MTPYLVYDVFTDRAFGGNQLAVIPDATGLPDDQLQKIAREFNFSETVFVYPPALPDHTAKLRIFTPTQEVPFAGHPTVGTAIALRDQGHEGAMVLELGIGPVTCHFDGPTAGFTIAEPLERLAYPDPDFVAAALGLLVAAIETATHAPVQAGVGLTFLLVQLVDRDALNTCQPVIDKFREGALLYPSPLDFAIFAYARDAAQIDARMFAPLDNIPEDPATGSASAALAALLTEVAGQDLSLDILQGEAMGRPSRIRAETKHGTNVAVTISGQAVRTMQGFLLV